MQSFNSALATDARGKSVAFPCIYEDAIARRRDRRGSLVRQYKLSSPWTSENPKGNRPL